MSVAVKTLPSPRMCLKEHTYTRNFYFSIYFDT